MWCAVRPLPDVSRENECPSGDSAGGACGTVCMMSRRYAIHGRGRDRALLYCLTQMALMVSRVMVNWPSAGTSIS